jgi:hypothetical protein
MPIQHRGLDYGPEPVAEPTKMPPLRLDLSAKLTPQCTCMNHWAGEDPDCPKHRPPRRKRRSS